MTEARVFIVDDDEAVVDSLSHLLRPLGAAIQVFSSGERFLQEVPASARGCMIVDLRMPGLSGIDLLQKIRDQGYDLHVVMVTGHADVATVTRVMKLGAIDFLEKPCPPALIVEAVRVGLKRTAEGTARAQPLIAFQQLVDQLAPDERAVLEGLVLGRTNPEIAEALDVSLRTVQARRSSIFEKLNVTNRAELVERALSAGWNPRSS